MELGETSVESRGKFAHGILAHHGLVEGDSAESEKGDQNLLLDACAAIRGNCRVETGKSVFLPLTFGDIELPTPDGIKYSFEYQRVYTWTKLFVEPCLLEEGDEHLSGIFDLHLMHNVNG